VLHVAAPDDNQARLEFLFLRDKRHHRLVGLCSFYAEVLYKSDGINCWWGIGNGCLEDSVFGDPSKPST
jgi:hypothetical protein